MKKVLVLFLAALFITLTAIPAFAQTNLYDYPTVYIKGKIGTLGNDVGTPEQKQIYDGNRVPVPEGEIEEAAGELVPMFIKAMLTDDYDAWAEKMSGVLAPIYKDFVLDKNGKSRPGSGQEKLSYDINNVTDVAPNGGYWRYSYQFDYDWRLSPLDVIGDLRAYIEKIKEVTHRQKVNLVARCEGACVAMAYLNEYGGGDIGAAVLLSPSSNGVALISDLFAGDIHLDGGAVNRYLEGGAYMNQVNSLIEDELLRRLLLDTVRLMAVTPGIDLTDRFVNSVFEKVLPMVMPGLLMTSYGTLPAYWAMVDDAHYDAAKKLAGIADDPEYANFVALIDDYHYNVQARHKEILESCKAQGMGLGILVKYGDEMVPFLADSVYPNDNTVTVAQASLGAATAKIGEKLPYENEFVSPDGLIDASTAALPENTWYVKYLDHDEWEKGVGKWGKALWNSGGTMTVDSDPAYPRFLCFEPIGNNDGVFVPLTAENAFAHDVQPDDNAVNAFDKFLYTIRDLLIFVITYVRGIIEGIVAHAKGTAQ